MRYVWPYLRERFMGAHVVWRWVCKMGTPTMRRPCPCHVNTPIFAPPCPRNFSRAGFASCAKFFKNFPQNIWKSVHYNPIFAASEIDIGRCSRVRHKFFEMIDMRQALYEPYGIRREHKIALGEWWKFMSDILSTRRVTGSKLHIMLTRLMLPT